MRYISLALARAFVLLAMCLLRPDDWAFERLWWVNGSLKMQMERHPRPPVNPDRHPAGGEHEDH